MPSLNFLVPSNRYDVQTSAIASYLGKTQFIRDIVEQARTKRIALQMLLEHEFTLTTKTGAAAR